jgi:hypothetical protein
MISPDMFSSLGSLIKLTQSPPTQVRTGQLLQRFAEGGLHDLGSLKIDCPLIDRYSQLTQDQPQRQGRISFWDQCAGKDKLPPPGAWVTLPKFGQGPAASEINF